MTQTVIALLGRKDEPTDAIEEYCRNLGVALNPHEIALQIRRVPWEVHGWRQSLKALRLQAANWRGKWVLVQYTAIAWSGRGFPFRFAGVLRLLKTSGVNVGVVYHDVEPYRTPRVVDRLRHWSQLKTMRDALSLADLAVFTVPPSKLSWLRSVPETATFIPVGPNLPFPVLALPQPEPKAIPTIGIFSITGGEPGAIEARTILSTVSEAARKVGPLRLSIFGRHAELREADLRLGFRGIPVDLHVEGVVSPEMAVERLRACDVLLFVRGGISSRRSSAIAGIAAGLPVVAYENSETAPPITEAGVVLVPIGQPDQLKAALVRVLTDADHRAALAQRSRDAYRAHFAWEAIALKYAEVLRKK